MPNDSELKHRVPLDNISEKEKLSDWWLKAQIDRTINSLGSQSKSREIKAFNIRAGKRNTEEFEYLTKKYGMEFPAQLSHIPLVKGMIDALLGIDHDTPLDYAVSSTDVKSSEEIHQNRIHALLAEVEERLKKNLKQTQQPQQEGQEQQKDPKDHLSEKEIEKLQKYYRSTWKDIIEENGFDVAKKIEQEEMIKLLSNRMFESLLSTGSEFYQVKIINIGGNPLVRYLDPRTVYYRKTPGTMFIKDCDRVMIKDRISVIDAINLYGHKMSKADRDKLEDLAGYSSSGFSITDPALIEHQTDGSDTTNTIERYYCEFKSNNKIMLRGDQEIDDNEEAFLVQNGKQKEIDYRFRQDRYEGVRLGDDIYVDMGMSKHISRSIDKPWECSLTINGVCYNDAAGEPYSLVLATKDLGDRYDILQFHLENLVALSGSKAVMVNFPDIPLWLGDDETERVIKWSGYLKQGIALFDTSQDGAGKFNNYGDIDLSMSSSAEIILKMLAYLEETASKITGVTRQAMGQIGQYDGKGTTEMARRSTTIVTRPLFAMHNNLLQQMMSDVVNSARISLRSGSKGTYMLGDTERKLFTLDARFPMADYAVHIISSSEDAQTIEKLQAAGMEMIKGQMIGAEHIVDIFTIKSLTKLKNTIKDAIESQKQDQTAQMQQQLEEAGNKLKELEGKLSKFNEQELQLKQTGEKRLKEESDKKLELQERLNDSTINLNAEKIRLEEERVKLENLQISYSNKSLEVRNK